MSHISISTGLICATTLVVWDRPLIAAAVIILSWFGTSLAISLDKRKQG